MVASTPSIATTDYSNSSPGRANCRSPWRCFLPRISMRTLMVLVLVIGGLLGWVVHRAKVQRDAVADLERAGFSLDYGWSWSGNRFVPSVPNPPWLRWLFDRLGPDYFLNVTSVCAYRNPPCQVDDHLMSRIGSLGKLETIIFNNTEGVTDDRLAFLANLTNLKGLYLTSDVRGDGLIHLKRMTSLQTLSLANISDNALPHLAGLTSLSSLNLGECSGVTDAGLEQLRHLSNLQVLQLHSGHKITTAGLESLRDMRKLGFLDLNHCGVDSLEPIRHLDKLYVLCLMGCPITDEGLAPVSDFKKLRTLWLSSERISDQGLEHLRGLNSLIDLELKRSRITNSGLVSLEGLSKLTCLDLGQTGITDDGLAHLSALTSLSTLHLNETRITDAGLATLFGLPALNTLSLEQDTITDAGISRLTGLSTCRNLWIRQTQVTRAGVLQLSSKLPALNITY